MGELLKQEMRNIAQLLDRLLAIGRGSCGDKKKKETEMKAKSKTTAYLVHSIAAAMLILTAQISLAGSATWLLSPQDSAWENPNNWTPGGPPNGPSDIATFAQSSQTSVNISTSEEVNSIVFTSDSASYDFSILG